MNQEETLQKLAASRQALEQAILHLSAAQLTAVKVEGVWTIKDIIGHLSAWEQVMVDAMPLYAAGRSDQVPQVDNFETFNDQQAAARQTLPLSAILEESRSVRQQLVAASKGLTAEQWEQRVPFPWGGKGGVAYGVAGLAEHEMEHVQAILSWRDRA